MSKFDLEKAKAGALLQTKDGRPVRIICFDKDDKDYPIVALIKEDKKEETCSYTNKGKYLINFDDGKDLIMAPTKRIGWINVYMTEKKGERQSSIRIYESKEEALKYTSESCLDTIQIEWEE